MNMLPVIAGLLFFLVGGLTPTTSVASTRLVTGFEYASTSGPSLVDEIRADGLTIVGSGAGIRSVTGFFGTPPSQGSRSLNLSIDIAEDIEGGFIGLTGTLNVSAGNKFAVDYIARRRASFGLPNPHINSYLMLATLLDDEGTAISDPIILAEGTSVVENILEYRTASMIVTDDGILSFGIYIFYEEGVAVSGRTFVLNIDNIRVESTAPAVVPVPASIGMMVTALGFLAFMKKKTLNKVRHRFA